MATDDVDLSGPFVGARAPVKTVTAAYTVVDSDYWILADGAGGAFDVTIPTAVGRGGNVFVIKRISAAANTITVKAVAGTLDGVAAATGVALDAQFKTRGYVSDGANWHLVVSVG